MATVYTDIIQGEQIPFSISLERDSVPISIDDIVALEYWCYTKKDLTIVKFAKADMVRVDAFNYNFWLDSALLEPGILIYEIYYAETNADIEGGLWEPRESVITVIRIKAKPISTK